MAPSAKPCHQSPPNQPHHIIPQKNHPQTRNNPPSHGIYFIIAQFFLRLICNKSLQTPPCQSQKSSPNQVHKFTKIKQPDHTTCHSCHKSSFFPPALLAQVFSLSTPPNQQIFICVRFRQNIRWVDVAHNCHSKCEYHTAISRIYVARHHL